MDKASKSELTRARLRRAAIDIFAREGFQRTRVSEIVTTAGVSQPAFYLYFESKEAIYEALVAEFREELRQRVVLNVIPPDTPSSRLLDRVSVSFENLLNFMAADRALTEIGFFQPPGCSETKQRMVGWVADNIEKEQEGRLYREDVTAIDIARLLVGLLDQMGRIVLADGDVPALARTSAKLFCGGTIRSGR